MAAKKELFPDIKHDIQNAVTFFMSKENSNDNFVVITTGHELCDKNKPIQGPLSYSYYILHFVHNGSGFLVLHDENGNQKTFKISKKQAFIIFPNVEYSYYPDKNDPWEYSWFSFFVYKDTTPIDQIGSTSNPIITFDNYEVVEKCFLDVKELQKYKYSKDLKASAVLSNALAEVIENKKGQTRIVANRNHIRECLLYIAENFKNSDLSVKEIANALFINDKYLSRLFSNVMGTSLNKYINQVRLKESCMLLSTTNKTISMISNLVGYNDPLYFTKKFTASLGISPTAWRKLEQIEKQKKFD